ncbi:ATP-binding protein [Arachnia propionica]|uniref:ATP-binding protein n=1 Tax=Arachnia propionica TaxID=1750 RepID=A0A3P1T2J6_9ACTN|nr:AAA family ATPase [Arachnia propionica]RRD03737.1 ATP-binding protein [Arachnia propionica]
MGYTKRLVDEELDTLLPHVTAIALDGPKGVGKTSTALRRTTEQLRLDTVPHRSAVSEDADLVNRLPRPLLIDEWQRVPAVWDTVRRAVDDGAEPGSFLLAGSAAPQLSDPIHSGAGRILSLRMRPMALCERGLVDPTVSLTRLLQGDAEIGGSSPLGPGDYVREILASGLPGLHHLPPRARNAQLRSYLTRVMERELTDEQGVTLRRPESLALWLRAYASASGTTASWEKIRATATPGDADPPSKVTTMRYRDWLTALWLLDPVPAWLPLASGLPSLTRAPKHHLADPALASVLLRATSISLQKGEGRWLGARGALIGGLFEGLATLSVRAAAQAAGAEVSHLRSSRGEREIDLIVEGEDGRILAVEVKFSRAASHEDVAHLLWLKERLGDQVSDMVLLNTGEHAHRRRDGVAVVPLALLGL